MAPKPDPNIVMTPELLNTLLEGMRGILTTTTQVTTDIPAGSNSGNFALCNSRFSGKKGEDVEAFINAISIYKECVGVTDTNALKGLPMLLDSVAATWWQGTKSTITNWEEAITALKHAYGVNKPPHMIFRELFSKEQTANEPTDIFVSNARALLSYLPATPPLDVVHQIDMIYSLLHKKIRQRIPRDQITSFNELILKARSVEETLEKPEFPSKLTNPQTNSTRPRCTYCKNFGHAQKDCRKFENSAKSKEEPVTYVPQVTCFGCKKPGHVKSNCPERKVSSVSNSALEFCSVNAQESIISPASRPVLYIKINNKLGCGIVDTAAKQSLAGKTLYHLLVKDGHIFKMEGVNLKMADGKSNYQNVLVTTVNVELHGRKIPTTFIVLPEADNNTLLGIDFIVAAKLILKPSEKRYCFADSPDDQFEMAFENSKDQVELNEISFLRENEGVMLSSEERVRLDQVLDEHREIFEKKMGTTPYAEHRIETGDHAPIAMPPYQMTVTKKEILKKEIDQLLDEDAIEECESPWAAPVVLVPKKDGTMRLCVDYRRLNSITKTDTYPLPRMDDLLYATKRTSYMSTLDLKSGYHQVSVREQDRDKTAFISPLGTYRYKVMPFGLRNAPATFQRLIDRFRNGLQGITLLGYLDDLIVISSGFEEHLEDLVRIFKRLKQFNLHVNRSKCTFACEEVKYLGHTITSHGIQVDDEKVVAITKRPPPRNVKEVQSFLQTASWYRRFIPKFSEISRPLSELTKKSSAWKWTEAQQASYENLKQALITTPVLKQNDPSKPYILRTDASKYALGAVLLQGAGAEEHPIEYASRMMTSAEMNYTATEREALAVVWSLNKFRGYLDCSSVIVTTDHQPLKWLLSLKSPTGRLARWALLIQSFNLTIEYLPGKRNVVADALSRPPCPHEDKSTCEVCMVTIDLPTRSTKETREQQLNDTELEKIIKCFDNKEDDSIKFWTDRGYLTEQGVLYRYAPEADEEFAQLVVPSQERGKILTEYHDSPLAGHNGIERTIARIASRYYWPGMRKQITDYVKRCVKCQTYKPTNLKPAGLLRTPAMNSRFEVLSIDLFGPLPVTAKGERWIFIVEDVTSRFVELFALVSATADECAKTLIEQVFLRYGFPRKIISDNGVQFVSETMQQVCYCLNIHQSLTPVYYPQANPIERRNRDLKLQLSILLGQNHTEWPQKLSSIRFALNTAVCQATDETPAFLTFARELRTPDDATRDLRQIIIQESMAHDLKEYLLRHSETLRDARDVEEREKLRQKAYADQKRRDGPQYEVGDKVWVAVHPVSCTSKSFTSKFAPKRDGPYLIHKKISDGTYEVAAVNDPTVSLGKRHESALSPYTGPEELVQPIQPLRRRGRPRKN